jgi:hypothetical protein
MTSLPGCGLRGASGDPPSDLILTTDSVHLLTALTRDKWSHFSARAAKMGQMSRIEAIGIGAEAYHDSMPSSLPIHLFSHA